MEWVGLSAAVLKVASNLFKGASKSTDSFEAAATELLPLARRLLDLQSILFTIYSEIPHNLWIYMMLRLAKACYGVRRWCRGLLENTEIGNNDGGIVRITRKILNNMFGGMSSIKKSLATLGRKRKKQIGIWQTIIESKGDMLPPEDYAEYNFVEIFTGENREFLQEIHEISFGVLQIAFNVTEFVEEVYPEGGKYRLGSVPLTNPPGKKLDALMGVNLNTAKKDIAIIMDLFKVYEKAEGENDQQKGDFVVRDQNLNTHDLGLKRVDPETFTEVFGEVVTSTVELLSQTTEQATEWLLGVFGSPDGDK